MFALFDLDDTLYDLTATFRRSHHIMMERLGIKLPEDLDEFALFTTVKKHSNTSLQMTITGELDPKDEFAYRFSRAYEEFGITGRRAPYPHRRKRGRKASPLQAPGCRHSARSTYAAARWFHRH